MKLITDLKDQFDLQTLDIINCLLTDAWSANEIDEEFGWDLPVLYNDLKQVYEMGLIDWSGKGSGQGKMPSKKAFPETRFYITELAKKLFSEESFNDEACRLVYNKSFGSNF